MVEIVELVIDGRSGDKELERRIAVAFTQYLDLWKMKHRKYGSNNIASMGKPGLVIRLNDKVQRLKNLVFNGEPDNAPNENELDTWMDIMGYAVIGLLVARGQWPKAHNKFLTFMQRLKILFQR
jgi:hypothetical protein